MKKAILFVMVAAITLFSVFSTQAQTLSELKEYVSTFAAECPTGTGDMDVFSVTMDDKTVTITFLVTENPKDEGFTIKELKKNKDGLTDLLGLFMTYGLLSQDETQPLITGCALNGYNLQYSFLSKKTKKSHTITQTNKELIELIQDFKSSDDAIDE